MKLRSLAMASLTAVLVTLSLPLAAQAGTAQAPASVSVQKPPSTSNTRCTSAESGTIRHCVRVQQLPLTKLTPAQRTERATMIRTRLGTTNAPLHASAAAPATTILPAPQCNFTPLGGGVTSFTANPDRFTSCADTYWLITNVVTVDDVTTVSTFNFEDLQWTSYSATSSTWLHGMATIGYEGGTNDLADGFTGLLSSNCTIAGAGVCTATSLNAPDPQAVDITPGSVTYYAWAETDDGLSATTADEETILDFTLGVVWNVLSIDPPTEAIDVPFGQADGPTTGLVGRCDTMATSTDGCVNEDFTPTLSLPVTQYGASAAMIQWAQDNLSGAWGLQSSGQPLYRLANDSDARANRRVICNTRNFVNFGPFIGGDYGDRDSCDEYPFAGTYESGALNGVTNGRQCAQVIAVEGNPGAKTEALAWNDVAVIGSFSASAACVRGHIPLKLNSGVGGAYGNLVQSQRLIDSDPFWVSVS